MYVTFGMNQVVRHSIRPFICKVRNIFVKSKLVVLMSTKVKYIVDQSNDKEEIILPVLTRLALLFAFELGLSRFF